jgi:hypothetical protein
MPRGVYNRRDDPEGSKLDEVMEREQKRIPHASPAADAARAKGTAKPAYGQDEATPRTLSQERGERRRNRWLGIVDQQLNHREIAAVRFDDGGSTLIIEFDD